MRVKKIIKRNQKKPKNKRKSRKIIKSNITRKTRKTKKIKSSISNNSIIPHLSLFKDLTRLHSPSSQEEKATKFILNYVQKNK